MGKDLGIGRRHLRGNEAAGGEANDIDGIEVQLAQHAGVKSAEVAVAPDPINSWCSAKSGLERNDELACLCQLVVPAHPPRVAQLVMKHEQRFTRAASDEH